MLLLAVTLLFLAAVLTAHLTAAGGRQGSYTVTARQTGETAQPQERLIDLNTADAETLQQLPGIGPTLAERIIAEREANGPFVSVDELTRVSGIGEKTVEAIRPYAAAGETGPENTGGETRREDTGS
ncbi:MAG: helix-hairpin-helix domain-containing protein [Ruminococcaceae bacterium]|jgi:competence protein ComEA|nr:helix-hairpin-helix domain-containing protein [Oscillospiraceae bacterium]